MPRKDLELHKEYQRMLQRGYRDAMKALKESLPCTDCGGFFPYYVTEWDHVPGRGKKEFNIATRSQSHPLTNKALQDEMRKCDLVCANCHKIRTHERR